MKLFKTVAAGAALGLAASAVPVASMAQDANYGAGEPGAVLFFPYLTDSKNQTNIRITNIHSEGVSVHFVRVCAGVKSEIGTGNCASLDFSRELTPQETLNLNVAGAFATKVTPNCNEGYIVAYVEDGFGSKIALGEEALIGDVSIETTTGGNRMGGAPATAIGHEGNLDADDDEPGYLEFDGEDFEKVSSGLQSNHRAGILATRGTKIFLGSIDVDAGKLNNSTVVKFDVYNQDEDQHSGQVEYVCSGWFDSHKIAQLSKDLPGGMGTPFGSIKWHSTEQNDVLGNPLPKPGIFGYWMREEGGGKRTLEQMWLQDDDDFVLETSFTDN